jgi:hypothetical protein
MATSEADLEQFRYFVCAGPHFARVEGAADRFYGIAFPGFLAESKDGGASWRPVEKRPTDDLLCDLTVSPGGDQICVLSNSAIWTSYDDCHSWTSTPLPPVLGTMAAVTGVAIQILDDGALFLIGSELKDGPHHMYFFVMTAQGAPWTQIGYRFMNPMIASVFHRPLNVLPDHTLLVGCYPGVYRLPKTTDGYGAFEHLFSTSKFTPAPVAEGFDAAIIVALTVSPTDHSLMAVAASIRRQMHINISTDGGATWNVSDPLPAGFLVDDMIFHGTTLYAKAGGTMNRDKGFQQFIMAATDKGQSWKDLTTPELASVLAREAGMFPNIGVPRRTGLAAADGQLLIYSPTIPLQSIPLL